MVIDLIKLAHAEPSLRTYTALHKKMAFDVRARNTIQNQLAQDCPVQVLRRVASFRAVDAIAEQARNINSRHDSCIISNAGLAAQPFSFPLSISEIDNVIA